MTQLDTLKPLTITEAHRRPRHGGTGAVIVLMRPGATLPGYLKLRASIVPDMYTADVDADGWELLEKDPDVLQWQAGTPLRPLDDRQDPIAAGSLI